MFEHKKQLLHEVKVERANPQYAVLMQEQLGGGNRGEAHNTLFRDSCILSAIK